MAATAARIRHAALAVLICSAPAADSQTPIPQPWVKTGGPLGGMGYDVNKSAGGGHTWFGSNSGTTSRAGDSEDAIPIYSITTDANLPDTVWTGTIGMRADGGATGVEKDNGVMEHNAIAFRGLTVGVVLKADGKGANVVKVRIQ